MNYKLDFYKLLVETMPTNRRHPIFNALMLIIATQLQKIHFEFLEFINTYEKGALSQKCYLQAEINKYFDPYKKRIFLRNITPNFDDYLIFIESENKPKLISDGTPFLIQNEDSLLANQINFEVVLPIGFSLTSSENDSMTSIINNNKLPSKKYSITNG